MRTAELLRAFGSTILRAETSPCQRKADRLTIILALGYMLKDLIRSGEVSEACIDELTARLAVLKYNEGL